MYKIIIYFALGFSFIGTYLITSWLLEVIKDKKTNYKYGL